MIFKHIDISHIIKQSTKHAKRAILCITNVCLQILLVNFVGKNVGKDRLKYDNSSGHVFIMWKIVIYRKGDNAICLAHLPLKKKYNHFLS